MLLYAKKLILLLKSVGATNGTPLSVQKKAAIFEFVNPILIENEFVILISNEFRFVNTKLIEFVNLISTEIGFVNQCRQATDSLVRFHLSLNSLFRFQPNSLFRMKLNSLFRKSRFVITCVRLSPGLTVQP